jgi:hypothetical protein
MRIKLFTMVKDEVDIIRDWIIYHGCMFGWDSIYVIDNFSTDGTYEIIVNEFGNLIHYIQEADYGKKGDLMTDLMNKFCTEPDDYAFPIDIDEFIVYYDKYDNNYSVCIDKNLILNYINNLPPSRVYKANYIYPINTAENGYDNATTNIDFGYYCDMGGYAKSFINKRYFNSNFDHGNHMYCDDYLLTKICLVHYHDRSLNQIKKKIENNVKGLGYQNNLGFLTDLIQKIPNCNGCHHVKKQIDVLNNNFRFNSLNNENFQYKINISNLKNKIIGGFY